MNSIPAILQLTLTSAHTLSAAVLRVEQRPGIATRPFFRNQVGNAGASVLTQVAAAQQLSAHDYFSKLEALVLLRGARQSLDELRSLLKAVANRRYIDEREATMLEENCDETMALLLAATVALRGDATGRSRLDTRVAVG